MSKPRKWRRISQIVLAARVVLVRRRNKKVLLLKRSSHNGWDSGKWELPGGKVEVGRLTLPELRREVWEETRVRFKSGAASFVAPLERINRLGRFAGERYMEFVFKCSKFLIPKKGIQLRDKEHEEWKWVTVEDAFDSHLTAGARKALQKYLESLAE